MGSAVRQFWTAPAERSGDGAFAAETDVRLLTVLTPSSGGRIKADALEKRCRAALATAVQNGERRPTILDCAGRAERRRRFRSGDRRPSSNGAYVVIGRSHQGERARKACRAALATAVQNGEHP